METGNYLPNQTQNEEFEKSCFRKKHASLKDVYHCREALRSTSSYAALSICCNTKCDPTFLFPMSD